MAKYRKISPRIWNDAKVRELSDKGKLAFLFLLTHPAMTPFGAIRANIPGLAFELGWTPRSFRAAMNQLCEKGMAVFDEAANLIWFPNFLKYNRPESPNVIKSWAGAFEDLPECSLRDDIGKALAKLAEMLGNTFAEAFREAFAEGLPEGFREGFEQPSRNQEQEQEIINTHPLPLASEGNVAAPPPCSCSREDGTNPRSQGTHPRALEKNPRAQGTNPRKSRASPAYSAAFEAFLALYPRKTGKDAAWKAWRKRSHEMPEYDELAAIIERQCHCEQWQRDGGQYIPNPATWINQGRWKDGDNAGTNGPGLRDARAALAPPGPPDLTDEEWQKAQVTRRQLEADRQARLNMGATA